ncbi:MAG: type I phosphomannose isomerase catalytic subunit [Pseudomonadota bacterium]
MVQDTVSPLERVIDDTIQGLPLYIHPYRQLKVWGVKGIGEYWYGAEAGEKSSTVRVGEDAVRLADIVKVIPEKVLGKKVMERFGKTLPLVKILTPKARLSVQFHDTKNELWIVTGIDKSIAGGKPVLIVGFSLEAVKKYSGRVAEKYGVILKSYGEALNRLIKILESSDRGKQALENSKNAALAAETVRNYVPGTRELVVELDTSRKRVEWFYNYRVVKIGDVIPIPSGTLHALGPGIEVVEPQIPGPTQSLEDGETYPVRYCFPGYERPGVEKMLDIDRVAEMSPGFTEEALPEIIKNENGCVVERLPGKFEDKGLEVHRIIMEPGAVLEITDILSYHTIASVEGKAKIITKDSEYPVPKARPNGEMLIIPASSGPYGIIAEDSAQIIDTFTPVKMNRIG